MNISVKIYLNEGCLSASKSQQRESMANNHKVTYCKYYNINKIRHGSYNAEYTTGLEGHLLHIQINFCKPNHTTDSISM